MIRYSSEVTIARPPRAAHEARFGDLKTVDGLADFGMAKAAWFKDSEGNTYELSEVMGV